MPVVLLTPVDVPAMVTLFNATSPMAALGSPARAGSFSDAFGLTKKVIGNKTNRGALTACVVSAAAERPTVEYNLAFGNSITTLRACFKPLATLWTAEGYTDWYALIPQDAEFEPFRRFMDDRWPDRYGEPMDVWVSETRFITLRRMYGTFAEVQGRV